MTSQPNDYVAVRGEDYLELARRLAASGDPASRRTAADRAYYAAFLFSRETKDVDIGEPDAAQEEIVAQPEPALTR